MALFHLLILNKLLYKDGVLTIKNPALDCEVVVEGLPHSDSWEIEQEGPVDIELIGELPVDDDEDNLQRAKLTFRLNPTIPFAHHYKIFERIEFRHVPTSNNLLVRRGQLYGLNMAVSTREGICLITDHMLLPLSWNRDAYYVARALLSWTNEMHDIVRRHLIWMFEIAERPGGVWGRCYLANGRQKDPAFQLDQQLWPLLELAEYVQETGDHATFERLQSQVSTILDTLLNPPKQSRCVVVLDG